MTFFNTVFPEYMKHTYLIYVSLEVCNHEYVALFNAWGLETVQYIQPYVMTVWLLYIFASKSSCITFCSLEAYQLSLCNLWLSRSALYPVRFIIRLMCLIFVANLFSISFTLFWQILLILSMEKGNKTCKESLYWGSTTIGQWAGMCTMCFGEMDYIYKNTIVIHYEMHSIKCNGRWKIQSNLYALWSMQKYLFRN